MDSNGYTNRPPKKNPQKRSKNVSARPLNAAPPVTGYQKVPDDPTKHQKAALNSYVKGTVSSQKSHDPLYVGVVYPSSFLHSGS